MNLLTSDTNQMLLRKLRRTARECGRNRTGYKGPDRKPRRRCGVEKLESQLKAITDENRRLKEEVKDLKGKLAREIGIIKEGNSPRTKADAGSQTENLNLNKANSRHRPITEEDILNISSYSDFVKAADMKWHENIHKRAFTISEFSSKSKRDTDLVVWIEENGGGSRFAGVMKALEDRYPELGDLDGNLAMLMTNTKAQDRGNNERISERLIFRAELEGTQEDLFGKIYQIRNEMVYHRRKIVAFYLPTSDKQKRTLRKND